ncbi:hypothetical protein NQ318_008042 [Aromia moschata]|uniref:BHLH domain-containing protein n=1 Tax=Aromia moschata TaxID=1265417 RepID=A0AAV8XZ96_9CUCU|nr:hypothetical protein NQ318_008042 [Aromia moschata]
MFGILQYYDNMGHILNGQNVLLNLGSCVGDVLPCDRSRSFPKFLKISITVLFTPFQTLENRFKLLKILSHINSREMRNKAEKQRRDRLNAFIGELATLVPMVARSAKRMDKTSILRLTATHLRIYQTLINSKGIPRMELPKHVDQYMLDQLVCDQLGGFLLILTPTGKIVFISHTVENLLGHLQYRTKFSSSQFKKQYTINRYVVKYVQV